MISLRCWFKQYGVRVPLLGPLALGLFRLHFASRYVFDPVKKMFGWLVTSREVDNFTYHLSPSNVAYLASCLATVTGQPLKTIERYISEIQTDDRLRQHLVDTNRRQDSRFADIEPKYGRRLGWYALVRATKPKVVVETGIDKGLGACVIAAALLRNAHEGHPGRYFGTDINPEAGGLLSGDYAAVGTILYGDSLASLRKFDKPIDLFINDSDHSSGYEAKEYQVVSKKLRPRAIILGDNSHTSDELLAFARRHDRKFLFFREEPIDHWYPGGGIGIAYR